MEWANYKMIRKIGFCVLLGLTPILLPFSALAQITGYYRDAKDIDRRIDIVENANQSPSRHVFTYSNRYLQGATRVLGRETGYTAEELASLKTAVAKMLLYRDGRIVAEAVSSVGGGAVLWDATDGIIRNRSKIKHEMTPEWQNKRNALIHEFERYVENSVGASRGSTVVETSAMTINDIEYFFNEMPIQEYGEKLAAHDVKLHKLQKENKQFHTRKIVGRWIFGIGALGLAVELLSGVDRQIEHKPNEGFLKIALEFGSLRLSNLQVAETDVLRVKNNLEVALDCLD